MTDRFEQLKLKNQLCFPLYACAKEVVRMYKPFLDRIDLTSTQYITMMLMWEYKEMKLKELGKYLYLDSGTLTPLLKKLEEKGFVKRHRSETDERDMIITVTEKGLELRESASEVPAEMSACLTITPEEAKTLYSLLYKLLCNIQK